MPMILQKAPAGAMGADASFPRRAASGPVQLRHEAAA
jgi:hypothetical protein